MDRAIVIGASGLIGRAVCRKLNEEGVSVVGVCRNADRSEDTCKTIVVVDVNTKWNTVDWSRFDKSVVINVSGNTNVYDSMCFDDNVGTAIGATEIAKRTGGMLVHMSSGAVYSGTKTELVGEVLKETDVAKTSQPYGRSKLDAEKVVADSGVNALILRLFGVLGSELAEVANRGNLVQSIIRAARRDEVVTVRTNEEGETPVRDYVDIEDVAEYTVKAAKIVESGMTGVDIVNLCSGYGVNLNQVLELAEIGFGKKLKREYVVKTVDNLNMVGSIEKMRNLFGDSPKTSVIWFFKQLKEVIEA